MKLPSPILLIGVKSSRRVVLRLHFVPSVSGRVKWRALSLVLRRRFDGVFFVGVGSSRPYFVLHSGRTIHVDHAFSLVRDYISRL